MRPNSLCLIVVVVPFVAAFAPSDPTPVVATIACSAKAMTDVKPGSTAITLGPASRTIPKGAVIRLDMFDRLEKLPPLGKKGVVPLAADEDGIHQFQLDTPIQAGTWSALGPIAYAWRACAAIAKWTPIVPNAADLPLRIHQPAASGPLSGSGENGAGVASKGPKK
jgi:hypothetical protein